jgi:hypothetical protein
MSMDGQQGGRWTAFHGADRIATGALAEVAAGARTALDQDPAASIQVFDDETGRIIDLDLRGTPGEVRERYTAEATAARGPGRPKLGVIGREVTLLPRHWNWLGRQPGGASVALRKLVDEARRRHADRDRVREAQEAALRFMTTMAGDRPGYEEAVRALFAADRPAFRDLIADWPRDVRAYAEQLAVPAWAAT